MSSPAAVEPSPTPEKQNIKSPEKSNEFGIYMPIGSVIGIIVGGVVIIAVVVTVVVVVALRCKEYKSTIHVSYKTQFTV